METITEALEKQIPKGTWCNNGGKDRWCPYFEVKKQTIAADGSIQSFFCNLLEEFVTRKVCGINESYNNPPERNMNAFRFGQNILRAEGCNHWKVMPCDMGGGARVVQTGLEIRIDKRHSEDYALILHEIAHITSEG